MEQIGELTRVDLLEAGGTVEDVLAKVRGQLVLFACDGMLEFPRQCPPARDRQKQLGSRILLSI